MKKWIKQHKRQFVALLTAALVCTSVQLPAVRVTAQNEGKTSTALSASAGVQSASTAISGSWTDNLTTQPDGYVVDGSTITISSAEGLAWLSVVCNGLNGQTANTFQYITIKLDADIDLAGKYWVPIGIYGGDAGGYTQFCGNFDGQGHTISNMSVLITEVAQFGGLFGKVYSATSNGASVKNLHMESPSVVRNLNDGNSVFTEAGCVVGHIETGYRGISSNQPYPVTIENISVHNGTVASNPDNNTAYTNKGNLGGIVGRAERGNATVNNWNIKNCFFQGTIINGHTRGGILGLDYWNDKAVDNCYYIAENVPYGSTTDDQEKANLGTGITVSNVADGEYTWKLDTGNGGSHNNIWQQDLSKSQSMPRVGTDSDKRVYKVTITGVDDQKLSATVYTNSAYTIPSYTGVTYKDASETEVSGQQTLTQDVAYNAYGTMVVAVSAKIQLTAQKKGAVLTITARMNNEDDTAIAATLTENISLYKGKDQNGELLEAKAFANGKTEASFEVDLTEWTAGEYDFYVSYPGDQMVLACDQALKVNLAGAAAVGPMEYVTVQKAFDVAATGNAVQEQTVVLLQDITVEKPVVLAGGQVTLDTNGYTLSGGRCLQVTGDAVFTLNGEKNHIVSKAAIAAESCAIENYGSCIISKALVTYSNCAIDNVGICTAQGVEIVASDRKGTAVNNKGTFVIQESSMNTQSRAIYNTGSCVVSGSSLDKTTYENEFPCISNEADMEIVNSRLNAVDTALENIGKLNVTYSMLEAPAILNNESGGDGQNSIQSEAAMKDCVGKGMITHKGKELCITNCNLTASHNVIRVESAYFQLSIEDSVLETWGFDGVIREAKGKKGASVVEIKNSSLIAPASGYAIAEPEATEGSSSATGPGVAPEVSDEEASDEEDVITDEIKYILENALIFGECVTSHSKGLGYTAWGNVSLPKSLAIPAGKTFTVKDGAVLTIPSGMELTNNGTLLLDGDLRGDGRLTSGSDAVFKMSWFTAADVTGMKSDGYDYKGSAYTLEDGLEDVTIAATKVLMEQTFAVDASGYVVSYENNVTAGDTDAAKIVWTKTLADGGVKTVEKTFTIRGEIEDTPKPSGTPSPEPDPSTSPEPSEEPTPEPSPSTSPKPSEEPTPEPSASTSPEPSPEPSEEPTPEPSPSTSPKPSDEPTPGPSPLTSPEPSDNPSPEPSPSTSPKPSEEPTPGPSINPSDNPTPEPSASTSPEPSPEPSGKPTPEPSDNPNPGPSPSTSPKPSDEPTPGPTPGEDVMKGDVNEDKSVTLTDAQMTLKAALKIIELSETQQKAADVDGKEGVTLSDAQMILKYALKIISKFD